MKRDDLRNYINLLKEEIIKANVKEVKIENNKLIYSLKRPAQRDISSYNKVVLGELGRAYAIVYLIKEFKATSKDISLEKGSPVGSPSKRVDIIIDIKDVYLSRKCIALVECKTSIHKISDREFSDYFKRQLYNVAHSYAKDLQKPFPFVLMAFEIYFENNKPDLKFYWFLYPEIENILQTGQISSDKIISRDSSFAYSTIPTDLYFSKNVKILKSEDLIEISKPNQLKELLKEKIHQKLRNYGLYEKAFHFILHLLLAKTYDEIYNREELKFQVKPDDYINKSDFYNRIEDLYRSGLEHLVGEDPKNAQNRKILDNFDSEKSGEILLNIVPLLQRIKLRSIRFLGEDTMGDIFLDFMHSIFRQSRGLFFTHPNICRFVCKAVNVESIRGNLKEKKYKYILDPSCGSGTFLIEALRLIFKDYSIDEIKNEASKILYGLDSDKDAVELCKVNMVIHGDGSANIHQRDALSDLSALPFKNINYNTVQKFDKGCTKEVLKEGSGFDFIITNPPFSIEIKINAYPHFQMNYFVPNKNGTTKASECFFVERWFQLLNPGGRLGAVIPFSLLDSKEYLKARMLFWCYFKIIAIVGLPEHAFSPHAQQRTALVFAMRRSLDESNLLFDLFQKINFDFNNLSRQAHKLFLDNNTIEDEKIEKLKDKIFFEHKEEKEFIVVKKEFFEERIIFYNAENVGYVRNKKEKTVRTELTKENDLTDDIASIIADAFEGKLKENEKIAILTLKELIKNENFNLSPDRYTKELHKSSISIIKPSETFTLDKEWEIANIERVQVDDFYSVLLCETGDIVSGGVGILTPKKLSHTTSKERARLMKKLKKRSFGKLKMGDVVISPVRIYQRKIAVITPSASSFLFSKDFIVLRKKDSPNLLDSFKLFFTLVSEENIKKLISISSTGKSGYPKIKDKYKLLKIEFHKIDFNTDELEQKMELYDQIYKLF